MSEKKQMSSYQRAIQKIAIYQNAINEVLGIIDDRNLSMLDIEKLKEAKITLIQAMMKAHNL